MNPTLWYVVVLIFGGGLLYALMKWNSKVAISIILPLYALLYFTYIFKVGGCVEYWGTYGFVYHPLWRGIADMSIGVVFWHIFSRIKLRIPLLLTNIISTASLFAIWVILFLNIHYDRYVLLFVPVLLIGSFTERSILYRLFQGNLWLFLGGLTFEMYLVHMAVIRMAWYVYARIDIPLSVFLVLYISGVVITALFLKLFVDKMFLKWKKSV